MKKNGKIKVLHLISGDLWAGAEVQAFVLLDSLSRLPELDLSVTVLNEGKLAKKLRKIGLDVTIIDESTHSFFTILHIIKENLRDKNIHILHSHRYKENVLAGLLKKSGIVQHLVQTVHGLSEPFKGIKMLKAKFYTLLDVHYTKRYFDKVQAVSFDIHEKLSRKINPAKLVTIHNSINTANITTTRGADEIKRELGIGENQFVIGSAGRLVPIKGLDYLLKATPIMIQEFPGLKVLIIGEGQERERLGRLASELGVDSQVIFVGHRKDIYDLIFGMDVFVLPSLSEGIPMALLEALALGVPVVASNVGGIPEILTHKQTGLLVPARDEKALADVCLYLLKHTEMARLLADRGKRLIQDKFSAEIMAQKVIHVYRSLVS